MPSLPQSGSITSGWLDSGIPRCRWHRIRVDAEVPKGTGIEISYVTTDFQPSDTAHWESPASDDWHTAPAGPLDILVRLPAGQYLQLKLALIGDGTHTPVVRSVRIDFPRRTSLDWLPAVYRENPEAEDFTERFLANFDASIEDADAAITPLPRPAGRRERAGRGTSLARKVPGCRLRPRLVRSPSAVHSQRATRALPATWNLERARRNHPTDLRHQAGDP